MNSEKFLYKWLYSVLYIAIYLAASLIYTNTHMLLHEPVRLEAFFTTSFWPPLLFFAFYVCHLILFNNFVCFIFTFYLPTEPFIHIGKISQHEYATNFNYIYSIRRQIKETRHFSKVIFILFPFVVFLIVIRLNHIKIVAKSAKDFTIRSGNFSWTTDTASQNPLKFRSKWQPFGP